MENTSMSEFDSEEVELLSKLKPEDGVEQFENEPKEQVQDDKTPADQTAAAEPAKDEAKEVQKEAPQGGDPRAALRAARHGERRALAHAKELQDEIDRLKAGKPATGDGEQVDDLAAVEQDFPQLKVLTDKVRELSKPTVKTDGPAAQVEEEFIPPAFNPEMQELIDGVPQLQAWQFDPAGQTNFQAAVKLDAYLAALPQWKDKPLAERLAEVTRRVASEAAQATPEDTNRRDPAEVIANLKPEGVKGISDMRGGAAPGQNKPNYAAMSDEDVMASLKPD